MRRLAMVGIFAGLLCGGCVGNLPDLVTAMGQDPATVCVQINTPYGVARIARTNIVNGDVACNGDGLSVKSQATQIGIPMQIIPQISIGVPTVAPAR